MCPNWESHGPRWNWTSNQGMCPDGELNGQPLSFGTMLQTIEPPSQSSVNPFKIESSHFPSLLKILNGSQVSPRKGQVPHGLHGPVKSHLCPLWPHITLPLLSGGSWHLLFLLLGSQSPLFPIPSSHCLNTILLILAAGPTQSAPLKNAVRALSQLRFSAWHWSPSNKLRSVYLLIICLHPLKIQYPEGKNLCLFFFFFLTKQWQE